MRGADLVVSLLNGKFKATYYKPTGRPHLILRERTKTDDHALVAEAFRPQWQRHASLAGLCEAEETQRDQQAVSQQLMLIAAVWTCRQQFNPLWFGCSH